VEPPALVVPRYLVKEVLQTLVVVLAVLLLIFVGRHFARYLAEAAAGDLPAELILRLLSMLTVGASVMLIPFAFFIAVLLAFGRLYRDNEMTALFAAGVSVLQVARPVFGLAAVLALIVAWLAFYGAPWAAENSVEAREQSDARSDLASIGAGQFREVGADRSVFYVESLSPQKDRMRHVFIHRNTEDGTSLFAAESGYQHVDPNSGDRFLVLLNGKRYEGTPGSAAFRVHDYQKASIRIEPREVQSLRRKRDARPTSELIGSDDTHDVAELQRRISMPLSLVLLGMLGVLVSRTSPREGRYARLLGAILIYVIYNNLMGVAQSWVQRGVVTPAVGMWWVHGLLLFTIAWLALRQQGWRRLSLRRS
jgi:lipopolysaccharide export system permease protein